VTHRLVTARRGQGIFKERVMQIEKRCRITRVENPVHLRASDCKPWRDSNNKERLDGENGLLLTPSIDHLFDRGFISFEDSGILIVSPVAHLPRWVFTEEHEVTPSFADLERYDQLWKERSGWSFEDYQCHGMPAEEASRHVYNTMLQEAAGR
jgi:hypothetical protein